MEESAELLKPRTYNIYRVRHHDMVNHPFAYVGMT